MINAYQGPRNLALKLLREAGRTWNSESLPDMADHLFNFCITHAALRDWVMATLEIPKSESSFHHLWRAKADGLFGECADIANQSKHLKIVKKTASVTSFREPLVAIDLNGNPIKGSEHERDSYQLVRPNGDHLDLLMLIHKVCTSWADIFSLEQRLGGALPSYVEVIWAQSAR